MLSNMHQAICIVRLSTIFGNVHAILDLILMVRL